jgi:superfamily II RNA helicase
MNSKATILSEHKHCPNSIKFAFNSILTGTCGLLFFRRMEAVYAWCKGVKFVQVQELTGTFEGTTIRTLRRLEELVRQIAVAAKAIGNVELQEKFEKGSDLIKRDIVFCSSLYL